MLVLTRKVSEKIRATLPTGQVIEFEVLGLRGDRVRLGVTADRSISVDREEVALQKAAAA